VHYTTTCNTQSSAPADERDQRPKNVELIGIINKPLLLHLVGVYIIQSHHYLYLEPVHYILYYSLFEYRTKLSRNLIWKSRVGRPIKELPPFVARKAHCHNHNAPPPCSEGIQIYPTYLNTIFKIHFQILYQFVQSFARATLSVHRNFLDLTAFLVFGRYNLKMSNITLN